VGGRDTQRALDADWYGACLSIKPDRFLTYGLYFTARGMLTLESHRSVPLEDVAQIWYYSNDGLLNNRTILYDPVRCVESVLSYNTGLRVWSPIHMRILAQLILKEKGTGLEGNFARGVSEDVMMGLAWDIASTSFVSYRSRFLSFEL
jgi:hypothetical protein